MLKAIISAATNGQIPKDPQKNEKTWNYTFLKLITIKLSIYKLPWEGQSFSGREIAASPSLQ